MKESLLNLQKMLEDKQMPSLYLLQPGLSRHDVLSKMKGPGISMEDLTELYCWKNGISEHDSDKRTIEQLEFLPGLIMLSLERAIDIFLIYTRQNSWSANLFPIFTDGGGDYILVNIDKSEEQSGVLYLYSPSLLLSEYPCSIYDSLGRFVETLIKSIEEGVYKMDSNNYMNVDYDLQYQVAKELNPKSEYWKSSDRFH